MNTCENSLLDVIHNIISSDYMVACLVDFTYGRIVSSDDISMYRTVNRLSDDSYCSLQWKFG